MRTVCCGHADDVKNNLLHFVIQRNEELLVTTDRKNCEVCIYLREMNTSNSLMYSERIEEENYDKSY